MKEEPERELSVLKKFDTELEEIFGEICDKYCKYPNDLDDLDEATGFPKHCKTCPMNKL